MSRLVFILSLVVIAAVVGAWYGWYQLQHRRDPLPGTIVSVSQGASLTTVTEQLRRANLLRHPKLFLAWARYTGGDRNVRAGIYRFEQPMSPIEILQYLQAGPPRQPQWVTIPEGYTVSQVIELLENKGLGGRDVFESLISEPSLLSELELPGSGFEGYLFPDTYAFDWTTPPDEILRAMVRRLRRVASRLTAERTRVGLTEAEMVILASIIEKETGREEERRMISAVFHNRLRLGMPLQSDPTVIYGLSSFDGNLTREHLQNPSPYNTYRRCGLPPGPIANPGEAALAAAVSPAPISATYFVARNDGSHEFSTSLAEHNRAVSRYQKRPRASER